MLDAKARCPNPRVCLQGKGSSDLIDSVRLLPHTVLNAEEQVVSLHIHCWWFSAEPFSTHSDGFPVLQGGLDDALILLIEANIEMAKKADAAPAIQVRQWSIPTAALLFRHSPSSPL